jgi:hypothetical protein
VNVSKKPDLPDVAAAAAVDGQARAWSTAGSFRRRRLTLAALVLPWPALAADARKANAPADSATPPAGPVARLFGTTITARDLGWDKPADVEAAAKRLRMRALREAMERYLVEHKLEATPEDFSAFARWDQAFRQIEGEKRRARLAQIEDATKTQADADLRKRLEQERGLLELFGRMQEQRSARPLGPGDEQRAMKIWIEGHKARKALYERYGGRVGITPFGPDPVGATEAWLREHEKGGRLRILHKRLAAAFWAEFAREPRQPARPEQIDFGYYWLKPVPAL